jgi:hypothetical protein
MCIQGGGGREKTSFTADASWWEKWSRVVFDVKMLDDGDEFKCECGMFAHM